MGYSPTILNHSYQLYHSVVNKMEEMIMHDGCMGSFENGMQVLSKVRMMGFSEGALPMPLEIQCANTACGQTIEMDTFESKCPHCGMVHAVTPCHAFDPANVSGAGIGV